jgi:hypothetical protein
MQSYKKHGFEYVAYADDIHIYGHAKSSDLVSTLRRLENCITDLQMWLRSMNLQMNAKKTEFVILGRKQIVSTFFLHTPLKLIIDNHEIDPKTAIAMWGAGYLIIMGGCLA